MCISLKKCHAERTLQLYTCTWVGDTFSIDKLHVPPATRLPHSKSHAEQILQLCTWVGEFPWDKRAALPLAGANRQWDGYPIGIGLVVEDNLPNYHELS